jgi:hypothetical protein
MRLHHFKFLAAYMCERRSKSAARGGVGRPVEKCSAQLCSGVGQENCGGAAISPYRERGTRRGPISRNLLDQEKVSRV